MLRHSIVVGALLTASPALAEGPHFSDWALLTGVTFSQPTEAVAFASVGGLGALRASAPRARLGAERRLGDETWLQLGLSAGYSRYDGLDASDRDYERTTTYAGLAVGVRHLLTDGVVKLSVFEALQAGYDTIEQTLLVSTAPTGQELHEDTAIGVTLSAGLQADWWFSSHVALQVTATVLQVGWTRWSDTEAEAINAGLTLVPGLGLRFAL